MNAIHYRFRSNLFSSDKTIELGPQTISSSVAGKNKTTIELDQIKYIRELSGGQGIDPESGDFEIFHCRIFPQQGRPVDLKSASYLGMGGKYKIAAKNQSVSYRELLCELKLRVAQVNPETRIINGSWAIAIVWWLVAVLSFGLLILGILGPIYSHKPLLESLPVLGLCAAGGLVGVSISHTMAMAYRPVSFPISDSLEADV